MRLLKKGLAAFHKKKAQRAKCSCSPASNSPSKLSISISDINEMDQYGATRLYKACQHGRTEEVASLLKHPEIDVNAPTLCLGVSAFFVDDSRFPSKFYRGPLHIACARGYLDIIILLLEHPTIDANLLLNDISPLDAAIYNGQLDVVALLMCSDKVDLRRKNLMGRTPLILALKYQIYGAVELILQHPNFYLTHDEGRDLVALFAGLMQTNPNLVGLFISKIPSYEHEEGKRS